MLQSVKERITYWNVPYKVDSLIYSKTSYFWNTKDSY